MVVLKLWRPVCGTNSNVHVAGPVTSGCPVREIVRVPFHVPVKKEVSPLEELLHPRKRELQKSMTLGVAHSVLSKTKNLRVAVSFENEHGVVQSQEQTLELGDEAADVKTLSVNLKIES